MRPRIEIAMVLAETSRMANTTAAQMLRMKAFTLPNMATKESRKACSFSVLVGLGELRNIWSMASATAGTSFSEATRVSKKSAWVLNQGSASSRYLLLKYME